MSKADRGTVILEDAEIVDQQAFPGHQFVLRVRAPKAAALATPGSFAHIACDPSVSLRRPLSIMRADPSEGWLEFLYKPRGTGLKRLAARPVGAILSLLAPIGRGFAPVPGRPRQLALGGGVGIPPMIFLADRARRDGAAPPLVLMGSEVPFPFALAASRLQVAAMPPAATHAVTLLESWGIPSRLASNAGFAGCYRGLVTDLARCWLCALGPQALGETVIFACGPTPMLAASARLAREFDIPCQVSLEEYMACGVGGCAGCNVRLETQAGPAMKRVCVDGPVFDAREVFSA
jgi:dihydroorotate dehydrogenase electron transfer subunit